MRAIQGLNDDFRDVLITLCDAGADFMIVGAYALGFHGAPRASGDIDLLVRPTLENAQKVYQALIAFGAPLVAHGVTAADFARPGNVYQMGLPPRRIDVLTEISGVPFEEAWQNKEAASLDNRVLYVIGKASYLKTKMRRGGRRTWPTQLASVGNKSVDVPPQILFFLPG